MFGCSKQTANRMKSHYSLTALIIMKKHYFPSSMPSNQRRRSDYIYNQSVERWAGLKRCQPVSGSPPTAFQTRMATAVCGLPPSSRASKPAKAHREQRRKAKDSRRRQAALLFLNNISLDGRPPCRSGDESAEQKADGEHRLGDGTFGGATGSPLPPADSRATVSQVSEPAVGAAGSSSSFPGVLTPPTRPASVTSPGFVGSNEVFLEGGGGADAQTPDTAMSPAASGHQPCSRVRSTPTALSPLTAASSLDSRQR